MLESIFDENEEMIEVLDETDSNITPSIEIKENIPTVSSNITIPKEEIIKEKTTDKVFLIQIMLIIAWVILTTVIYFFGYSLFEPFINV